MNPRLRTACVCATILLALSGTALAQTYTANLSGAQEVPPSGSSASGFSRLLIDEDAGTLTFQVVFNGLSSAQTASHIHAPAPIGANTGVAINLGAVGGTTGTISGTVAITPTQIEQLRAGTAYVNVHSTDFPGGEIRGQIAVARVVDFDGDGETDYSILRFPSVAPPGVSPITYYNLNSTSGFQAIGWGDANLDFPTPGDYDGDGVDDLALYRAGSTAGAQSVFYIRRSSDGGAMVVPWGTNGDIAVNRDYDGDGITDLAIFRSGAAAGAPSFWWIRHATGTVRVVHWGTTGATVASRDLPMPSDYDGDGKVDIAIYRTGTLSPANTFIVLRSSDSAVTYQRFGVYETDYVLPGDFDGDGRGDYAVARTGAVATNPMVWYILQSSNGSLRVYPFGVSSDLPTPGDYDGDGRADFSIYRPGATAGSQSYFWSVSSLSGAPIVRPWGLQGDFAVATFSPK